MKTLALALSLFVLPYSSEALNNMIRLAITGNGYSDEIALRFDSAGTTGFNSNLDAWKIFSPNSSIAQLYSRTAPGEELSIYAMPLSALDTVINLYIRCGKTGLYNFNSDIAGPFKQGSCIILQDNITGKFYDLSNKAVFSFNLTGGTDSVPRFSVHFKSVPQIKTVAPECFGYSNGSITVNTSNSAWTGSLTDSAGNMVTANSSFRGFSTISHLAAGKFTLDLTDTTGCRFTGLLLLPEALKIKASFCFTDSSRKPFAGEFVRYINNSQNSSLYHWDFGDSETSQEKSPVHRFSKPGIYNVTLSANNGTCFTSFTRQLEVIDVTTSVQEPMSENKLSITYEAGRLIVKKENNSAFDLNASLYSLDGRLITIFTGHSAGTYNYDLPPLCPAVYILKLSDGQKAVNKKFFVSGTY